MLPKNVYSKVVQSLNSIKKDWMEDRKENPNAVPYEIDISLKAAVERHIREGKVYCNQRDREVLVNQTIAYLRSKGLIVSSGLGGHIFPLPEGHRPMPTKEQLTRDVLDKIDSLLDCDS